MTPKDFFAKYFPFALQSQNETGINAYVTLAQAALESGWGEKAPQNNFFGIKSFGNPEQQLLTTFEYSKQNNLTPKQIGLISISAIAPSVSNPGYFKYTGQSWFRSFKTPADAFADHAQIFFRVKVYADALLHKDDIDTFVKLMAPHYAQSPVYADTIISIVHTLQKLHG